MDNLDINGQDLDFKEGDLEMLLNILSEHSGKFSFLLEDEEIKVIKKRFIGKNRTIAEVDSEGNFYMRDRRYEGDITKIVSFLREQLGGDYKIY